MPEAQVVGVPHRKVRHFISASSQLANAKARFVQQQRCLTRKAMTAARRAISDYPMPASDDCALTIVSVDINPQTKKGYPIECALLLQRVSPSRDASYNANKGPAVPSSTLLQMKQSMEKELSLLAKFVISISFQN